MRYIENRPQFAIIKIAMGCRQVVRHKVLVLAFGGSNPSIPTILCYKMLLSFSPQLWAFLLF